jgi:hypothetical protein
MSATKGPVSQFITHHYRHFNAATLIDAAKGYEAHLTEGGKMMITLAGAMSTAELGVSLAEMIRQDKVQIISCTGANLEEDLMNLVAHTHYKRVPNYRDLSPKEEWELLENGFNRVTDTCNNISSKYGKKLKPKASAIFRMNICTRCCYRVCLTSITKLIPKIRGCWLLLKKIFQLLYPAGKIQPWETSSLPIASKVN